MYELTAVVPGWRTFAVSLPTTDHLPAEMRDALARAEVAKAVLDKAEDARGGDQEKRAQRLDEARAELRAACEAAEQAATIHGRAWADLEAGRYEWVRGQLQQTIVEAQRLAELAYNVARAHRIARDNPGLLHISQAARTGDQDQLALIGGALHALPALPDLDG